jgi:hypothetical protein
MACSKNAGKLGIKCKDVAVFGHKRNNIAVNSACVPIYRQLTLAI